MMIRGTWPNEPVRHLRGKRGHTVCGLPIKRKRLIAHKRAWVTCKRCEKTREFNR